MKRTTTQAGRSPTISFLLIAIVLLLVATACGDNGDVVEDAETSPEGGEVTESDSRYTLRIGYVSTVPTLAQIAAVMTRTDVFDQWGLDVQMFGFPSVAELGQAAAGGGVDDIWGSDLPVTGAILQGFDFTFVSNSVGWRWGFAVREDSDIETLADLKGKCVGVHHGIATQVNAMRILEEEGGLDPRKDVELVNIQIGDSNTALATGEVDAVVPWDPAYGLLENSRSIWEGFAGQGERFPGTLIAVPDEVLELNREAVVRFLAAQIESIWFAIENPDQTAEWVHAETDIPVDVILSMAEFEPLWQAETIEDIDITISDDILEAINNNSRFFEEERDGFVDAREHFDPSVAQEAMERVQEQASNRTLNVTDS